MKQTKVMLCLNKISNSGKNNPYSNNSEVNYVNCFSPLHLIYN